MAGEDETVTNNEILNALTWAEEVEEEEEEEEEEETEGQSTSAQGELHSRVGGILECDPSGNKNSSNERIAPDSSNGGGTTTAAGTDDDNEDGLCRYALGAANRAMSFIEICQVS